MNAAVVESISQGVASVAVAGVSAVAVIYNFPGAAFSMLACGLYFIWR